MLIKGYHTLALSGEWNQNIGVYHTSHSQSVISIYRKKDLHILRKELIASNK